MSARYDVMVELYELFNGDTGAGGLRADPNALVTAVYDEPPQDTTEYPFLQIGDATETPQHSFTSEGWDVVCTFRIWSQYEGFVQAAKVLRRISELIERDDAAQQALRDGLAARGWSLVRADYLQSDSQREPENPNRQVPVRLRVWVQRPR